MKLPDAYNLLHEGAIALARIETNGIAVDIPYLEKSIFKVDARAKKLQEKLKKDGVYKTWQKRYGLSANLGSREQLCRIMFEDLKLPYDEVRFGRTGITGRWKATEDVVASIDLPFCRRYTRLAKLTGLKARLTNLQRETVNGRLHSTYNLHLARSYRSSSGADKSNERAGSEFNFQNIPTRDEIQGQIIRRAFIPSPGCRLIENDMAAHEFRIAACIWQDPEMIAYVKEGRDIHCDLASKIFICKPNLVSKGMRYLGKNGFVFPVLYGSYYVQVARNVWRDCENTLMVDGVKVRDWLASKGIRELGKCDPGVRPLPGTFEDHIKGVENWFMDKFHVFAERKAQAIEDYRKSGGFSMVTGFQVDGIHTNNAVMNYGVQGPAFHCLLKTIIEVQRRLRKYRMKTKLVGTIHDSIEADSPEKEVGNYLEMVWEVVVEWLPKQWPWIIVPLEVEAEVTPQGGSWFDKKKWERKENGKWEEV